MKKRRILALLLALSLSVSMNGMTVLATAPGSADISVATEEESDIPGQEDGSGTQGTEDSGEEDKKDDQNGGETAGGETDPGESSEGGETSKDDGDGSNSDNKDDSNQEEEPEEPVDPEEGDGADDVTDDETLEGDTETPDEKLDEEEKELPEEETDEVRMESFTDETGMTITYDAVMAASFEAEIRGATLYAVPDGRGVLDLREETITEIAANAFQGGTNITYIMLPSTVKVIGSSAFEGCSALKGISIPSRLTEVGENAFKGCTSLTQLALPNSVTTIGAGAFQNDSRLFMVHMVSAEYSKLKTIGANAFSGCSALEFFCSDEEYRLPDSITSIGENAFSGCRKIKNVNMSDTLTSLGSGAYQNCSGLSEVSLSSGLAVIPENAFAGCSSLEKVAFGNNNMDISTEISGRAFYNCSKLGNIELPEQINRVCTNAFGNCKLLKRVYVKNGRAILDSEAFPDGNEDLCLVATSGSTASKYAKEAGVRFVPTDDDEKKEYYTYKQRLLGAGTETGQINLKVTAVKSNSDSTPDINSISNGTNTHNGVVAGTTCYIWITWGGVQGVQLVEGSMKCNGTPVSVSGGYYSFVMPIGGATITAEFELKAGSVLIEGNEDSVEGRLSTDANFVVNSNKMGFGTMKVGQSTKFYLTDSMDGAGSRIPVSKVKYYVSGTSPKGIISVDKNGTVKALKAGTAVVCADVKNIEGDTISRMITITVEQVKVDHISMLVTSYDKDNMTIDKADDSNQIVGISVPTNVVTKNYTFNLKASAFATEDDGEALDVPFTWATSDAKVAKLARTSTTAASSVNTVTIPINTDGEATITVTATNADKTKVTQKFVVSVQNYIPRLASSKITINPNQVDGTTELGIISAYGQKIDTESVKVIDAKVDKDYGDFILEYVPAADSEDPLSIYKVSVRDGLPDKTYAVRIQVKVGRTTYKIPLTIVVKKVVPNPKVSFAKDQKKINLFYANDGIEVKPLISNLGTAEVESYTLEPLTEPGSKTYEDDVKFTENFEINTVDGQPVITQKGESLACNKAKKPVVTGYLVLKFKDYKKNGTKKYKITIPTQTVAPAYVLDRTANTFGTEYTTPQVVYLKLLDKKTKKMIDLHPEEEEGQYELVKWNTSTTDTANCSIVTDGGDYDGMIRVTLSPNPDKGRLVMRLTNSKWAEGKQFMYTYQINTDSRAPKISLKTATVNINASYPEQEAAFELVSNQYDTRIVENQTFEAVNYERLSVSLKEQYDKLAVNYENGKGTVSLVQNGGDIKPGTYKFICNVRREGGSQWDKHNVTLAIRVTKTVPTVTLKGTNAFNLSAYMMEGQEKRFIEKSETTFTTKNLPKDYVFNEEESFKTIECTTKGYAGIEECFDFQWNQEKNVMEISMKEAVPARTYSFRILPTYSYTQGDYSNSISPTRYAAFSIKVYNGKISVRLGARGRMNLVDRNGECTEKNAIRYTPTFTNLKDTLSEVVILDASGEYPTYGQDRFVSKEFEAKLAEDGKSFFITPKDGVEIENRKSYPVRIWMKTAGYIFPFNDGGGIYAPGTIKISTAEILPKVKTDKTAVDLYLSSKSYKASFVVTKADQNAVGVIEEITFGEKDVKARESFDITYEKQQDGSLKVYLKLKNAVSYGCNSTNRITMYIKFKGQGTNTAGTAVNMNVKINK